MGRKRELINKYGEGQKERERERESVGKKLRLFPARSFSNNKM